MTTTSGFDPGPVPDRPPTGDRGDPRRSEDRYRNRIAGPWDQIVRVSHCVDCYPGTCSLQAWVRDGVVVREESPGDLPPVEPGVPDYNPLVCQKGLAWSRQVHAPDRVLHPLRRVGERGSGEWEHISWDEALTEIADAVIDAIEEIGPEAIVHEGSPEIGAVVPASRFTRVLGATALDVNGSINDFWAGFHQVFGKFYFSPSLDDAFHADCILIWHSNPAYTQIPVFHFFTEARYRGARVVLISPDVSPSHSHADLHVPIRHGTDGALALALAQVVMSEGLTDWPFVARQTDLSLLVRTDTGGYLRASDLERGGRDDRFFHAHPRHGIVPADPANLDLDFEPVLDPPPSWTLEAKLADGAVVAVEPLAARLRRHLDAHYTPEAVAAVCGVHPDTTRTLARLIAQGRTRIPTPGGLAKYFHGDLMARAILLVLALTGNWGKKGAGAGGWATGLFDGQTVAMSKTEPGVAGAEMVLGGLDQVASALAAADPSLTGELPTNAVWRSVGRQIGMKPPAFFWYHHAGYRSRWEDPEAADPTMPRSFADHLHEAVAARWWDGVDGPGPDHPPRVLIEIAGNMLRRSRGGKTVLLQHLWPQLTKVVVCDTRMSQTARYADLVLPAAHHYEKPGFGMTVPWTMTLAYSNAAVAPAGEARTEWTILSELCRVLARRASERGLASFTDHTGLVRRYEQLWDQFTLNGTLTTDDELVTEMVDDAVFAGTLPSGTTIDRLRDQGWTPYSGWASMMMAQGQASPFPDGETHSPLRNHVELGHPYPTLTRRAQFLIDHPWYVEAGEDLPVHKEPPPMGGDHPLVMSSGHNRWSIHAMNTTNPLLLQTHRGKPFVLVNDRDAADRSIADDSPVRVFNDLAEIVVACRTSPAQRPGALTIYNGFEDFMFGGDGGPNELELGLVKWLGLVGGYGHLTYTPTEWQPVPSDRCVRVDIAPA